MEENNKLIMRISPPELQTEGYTPFWTDKEFTEFQLFSFTRYVEAHRRIDATYSYQEIYEKWDKRGRTDY